MRCRLMYGRATANLLVLQSSFCAPAVLCLLHYRSVARFFAIAGIEIFNSSVCDVPECIAVKRVHYATTSTRRFFFNRPYSIDTLEW